MGRQAGREVSERLSCLACKSPRGLRWVPSPPRPSPGGEERQVEMVVNADESGAAGMLTREDHPL
jgi:hypothetical protein